LSANDLSPVRHAFPAEPPFDRIVAAFTTRHLGRSGASCENLNTGLHTGDNPVNVLKKRKLVFDALGLDAAAFTAAKQVHGDNVCRVTAEQRGRGAVSHDDAIPSTDALITDVPGVPIGVFTADCVPVFLYDPRRVAVGIVHAGWRSTALSIVSKAARMMEEEFGSDASDIWAAFGPSIGPCCYEVGRDVFDAFRTSFKDSSRLFQKTADEKWHLDLWLANRRQLEECGITGGRTIHSRICSACNADDYFSARRLGPRTGRTLSVIAIRHS
jgi:YfiH family protein